MCASFPPLCDEKKLHQHLAAWHRNRGRRGNKRLQSKQFTEMFIIKIQITQENKNCESQKNSRPQSRSLTLRKDVSATNNPGQRKGTDEKPSKAIWIRSRARESAKRLGTMFHKGLHGDMVFGTTQMRKTTSKNWMISLKHPSLANR